LTPPARQLDLRPAGVSAHALLAPAEFARAATAATGVGRVPLPAGFEGFCTLFARDFGAAQCRIERGTAPGIVTLPALVRIALQVWAHVSNDHDEIRDQIANLNLVFNGLNPAGVVFDLKTIETPPQAAWEQIGHNCRQEDAVRRSEHFDETAVNVYVHGSRGVSARCCSAGDMVFLGPGSPLGRLAHEIGHALGLRGDGDGSGARYDDGHTDSLPAPNPFSNANLMWRAHATLPHHLTLGQMVWIHFSERSILRKLGDPGRAPGGLARWAEDDPGRTPAAPEATDLEAALATRYDQILAYWREGGRPEGRPGSASKADFIRRHRG
jgi:hypothetical protein